MLEGIFGGNQVQMYDSFSKGHLSVFSYAACQFQQGCILTRCPLVCQLVYNQLLLVVNPGGIIQGTLTENVYMIINSIILFMYMFLLMSQLT